MGGSINLPQCQGTPVQPYRAVIGMCTNQAWVEQGVSNTTVIFWSLEKLTVKREGFDYCTGLVILITGFLRLELFIIYEGSESHGIHWKFY